MSPVMLRFDNVSMTFDTAQILRNVSFSIRQGSFHYIRGASGSGKSTLIKLAYRALMPESGSITLFGEPLRHMDRLQIQAMRQKIGVVYQDFRLIDHLSAFDNVALRLMVAGRNQPKIRRDVSELLDWVGLGNKMQALPPTFSGGEKQRLAIACAVINKPKLLLADEPTGSVDDAMAVRLMYLFDELNRLGTTTLMVTHNQSLVDQFPHPQLHLHHGRIYEQPPLADAA